jgi:hypothetical protein
MTSGHAEFIASYLLLFVCFERTIEIAVLKSINVLAITREEMRVKTIKAISAP